MRDLKEFLSNAKRFPNFLEFHKPRNGHSQGSLPWKIVQLDLDPGAVELSFSAAVGVEVINPPYAGSALIIDKIVT